MKILNISLDKKLFEAGSRVEERVLEYAEIFDRFDILVLCGAGHEKKEFDQHYAEGYGVARKIVIWPTNSKNKLHYLLDALRLGGEMIEKYGYEAVSVQEPFETGFIGRRLARKYGLKFQVQLHGDFFGSSYFKHESLLNWFRYYLGRFIIGRADGIRVVSERIKRSLLAMGIDEKKISVVPIYTDLRFKNYDLRMRKDEKKFVFLTVGRLAAVKNIEMQIGAIAKVVKKHSETELWIVGEGAERNKLVQNIHFLSFPRKRESRKSNGAIDSRFRGNDNRGVLGDCVKFFGWHNNLSEFYQTADAFLLTSNYEGWGLAAVEAASYGLPIIMTDVGCAGEVIVDGESGLVVPVGDGQKLAENMLKLISDENLRKKLGEGAKQAVSRLPDKGESLRMYGEACEVIRI